MARHPYPQFTRRDFQFIADILAELQPNPDLFPPEYHQWKATVQSFANHLAACNTRFDKTRFLSACGLDA